MYNKDNINAFIKFIESKDGINNKDLLKNSTVFEFKLTTDRSLFYTKDFAVRFSKSESLHLGNTILSLSALQKYDDRPVIICICTPIKNHMVLANSSFIKKISHSSKELRADNIRGSFNGTDIISEFGEIKNEPRNFETLFAIHQNITFEENLLRLVELTTNIIGKGKKYEVTEGDIKFILESPRRALDFINSPDYKDLLMDLDSRVNKYRNEIFISALIPDVKLRGEIIEYIISGDDEETKNKIINYLEHNGSQPHFTNPHSLGDYSKKYQDFVTETDIKTKIMIATSSPKGYNIDKVLEFLSHQKTVFMLYLVGIDYSTKTLKTKLISIYQKSLMSGNGTVIQEHWSGRNSRGTSQFNGEIIKNIILNEENEIDSDLAKKFIEKVINL
jgi:hypothetical protein